MHHRYAQMAEAISKNISSKLDLVFSTLDSKQIHVIQSAITFKTSSWLTALSAAGHHFDRSANRFRDALTVRYCQPLWGCQSHVIEVSGSFNYKHALDFKKAEWWSHHQASQ